MVDSKHSCPPSVRCHFCDEAFGVNRDREPAETFTCEMCGETFPKGRADEEAIAEMENSFGNVEDPAVVCDKCYRQLLQ